MTLLLIAGAAPPDTYPPVPWTFVNLLLRLCWLGGALLLGPNP
jgi:hypothetical protein